MVGMVGPENIWTSSKGMDGCIVGPCWTWKSTKLTGAEFTKRRECEFPRRPVPKSTTGSAFLAEDSTVHLCGLECVSAIGWLPHQKAPRSEDRSDHFVGSKLLFLVYVCIYRFVYMFNNNVSQCLTCYDHIFCVVILNTLGHIFWRNITVWWHRSASVCIKKIPEANWDIYISLSI